MRRRAGPLFLVASLLPAVIVDGQECSCGYPCDVVLEYHNIFGLEDHRACLTITAGPELRIEWSADVTLTAGDRIVLENGFSVSQGGALTLALDLLLFCDVTFDGDGDLSNACLDCDDGQPTVHPDANELCDGLDNDCDGTIDEGNPDGGGACDTGLPGVCAAGTQTCIGGSLQCAQNVLPTVEVCDGLDNDCDGTVDEGNPGGGGACSTGLPGVCAAGTVTCVAGAFQCEQNVLPTVEVCDGLDNDCDGTTDEGLDGDSSNGDVDFPDSWPGPEVFEPGYPTYTSGTVHAKILPAGDEDWFAIYAVEDLSDFCLTDDEPIKAEVNVTPPGSSLSYEVCACWSSDLALCEKSQHYCVTGAGATSTNIYLEMDMQCGATDTGYLDIQVRPDTPELDSSCLEYTVSWAIWE